MPHDQLYLDGDLITELFPFHLLVSTDEQRRILSLGTAIERLLPPHSVGRSFDDFFSVSRPAAETLSMDLVETTAARILFIKVTGADTTLRGQLVLNAPESFLFLGTLLVTAANTLDVSEFSLADFPPL